MSRQRHVQRVPYHIFNRKAPMSIIDAIRDIQAEIKAIEKELEAPIERPSRAYVLQRALEQLKADITSLERAHRIMYRIYG